MTIATYADLAQTVKTWCARSDSAFSNQIETFVALHELRMYNGSGDNGDPMQCDPLMAPEIEVNTTIAITAGAATVPTDCNTIRTLTRPTDQIGLDFVTPRQYDILVAQSQGGDPEAFTVKSSQILVVPATTDTFDILYYKKLPAITVEEPSNALLTNYPLLYFHGVMFEAYSFMQEVELATAQFMRYRAALSGVNTSIRGVRFGGTPLRVATRNPIP